MKVRLGHVTNSSSSSFVIGKKTEEWTVELVYKKIRELYLEYIEKIQAIGNLAKEKDLGFELPLVRAFCNEHGVRIRCFANVAQSRWEGTPIFKKFFIRPEDVDIYEDYVETDKITRIYTKELIKNL